jgi:molecular chaperone GrpE
MKEDYDDTDDVSKDEMESDAYVLDLEDEDAVDLDALTKEAVDAVSRVESGEMPALQLSDIEALEAEIVELRDRSVRTLADFENFRRRSEREREDLRRYAVFEVMRDFLPILDNLGRALTAGGSADDLKIGVEMILKQMEDMLRQMGVEKIEAEGQPFDPSFHEAVARDEVPGVSQPTVREELQRGYRMHQRLLRPALVRVAMPAPESSSDEKE